MKGFNYEKLFYKYWNVLLKRKSFFYKYKKMYVDIYFHTFYLLFYSFSYIETEYIF